MRRFLLVGVSVFALNAGNALAEQSTTVDDTSEGSVNIINQSAAGTDSTVSVIQTGEGADAPGTVGAAAGVNVHIDQTSDDDSTIDVSQDGLGDGNSIFIDQDVIGGPSTVMATQIGEANKADIIQAAADSDVTLLQDGEGNMATVDQMMGENTASIDQTGEMNTASVDQAGEGNTADVDQWGEMNMASVLQDGEGNSADVDQGADGAPVEMNVADVFQHGTESFVVISQLGSDNMASATQNVDVDGGAMITITQEGTGGSTTITQN